MRSLPPDLGRIGGTRRPRWVRGFLSALVPGLGQLVGGRLGSGLLFLAPVVALALAGLVAAAINGPLTVAAWFADPTVLAGLLFVEAAVLVWRILAVVSSLELGRARWRLLDVLPALLLGVVVMVPQVWAGTLTAVARQAAADVFGASGQGSGVWQPSVEPSPSPSDGGAASPSPVASHTPTSPSPSPATASGRITVLLLGVDGSLEVTDTMIVASLDTVGKTVSMLSIPRDTVDVPLPNGEVYRGKLNALYADATRHPGKFPGSGGDGHAVLVAAVSALIGVPVQYWAQLYFDGLVNMVDTVGGVDVTVPKAICDTTFDQSGFNGFSLAAGRVHLDGLWALTYARIRKAPGESDFTRAKRQQDVILAIRAAALRGGILRDPIGFVDALGKALRTNVPPSLLPRVVGLADQVGPGQTFRMTLIPPRSLSEASDSRGYILEPNVDRIRSLAAGLFPAPGTEPVATSADTLPAADTSTTPGGSPSLAPDCPARNLG